ncbi:MAG: LacI family DNA-binding transcriptional regulator [Planctomycetota bacterium]
MSRVVTMSEMARELGVSRITVSSVVNDHARERGISEKTERRVRSFLEKRGYVPSRGAVRLRGGARQGVGLFLCGPMYTHLMEAFNRFVVGLADMPGTLEIMMVSRQNILEGVRELVSRGVSSVVWIQTLSSAEEFREPAVLNYLSHTHTVLYNYPFGEGGADGDLIRRGFSLVGVNRAEGHRKLAVFLRGIGHRRVAVVHPLQVKCFQEAGLDPVLLPSVEEYPVDIPQEGRRYAGEVLKRFRTERITAVCFTDDEEAGFALREFRKAGVRVPKDLTVVGFDGIKTGEVFDVPLTTLAVPVKAMVDESLRMIRKGLRSKRRCLRLNLIRRESHGPAGQR